MRINVYSQELTKETAIVTKKADTGLAYCGVRLFLASPDLLHHSEDDDDRSAITFWIPNAARFTQEDFALVLEDLAAKVRSCPRPDKND